MEVSSADSLPASERELSTFILLGQFSPLHFRGNTLIVVDHDAGEIMVARSSQHRRERVIARVYDADGARLRTIISENGRIR